MSLVASTYLPPGVDVQRFVSPFRGYSTLVQSNLIEPRGIAYKVASPSGECFDIHEVVVSECIRKYGTLDKPCDETTSATWYRSCPERRIP